MGGMGLIFTPVLVRHLLRPSSLVWAYDQHFLDSQLLQTVHDITVVVKKVAQNPVVLASYYR